MDQNENLRSCHLQELPIKTSLKYHKYDNVIDYMKFLIIMIAWDINQTLEKEEIWKKWKKMWSKRENLPGRWIVKLAMKKVKVILAQHK